MVEKQYDWATWRMYHRITSARQKRAAIFPEQFGTSINTRDEDDSDADFRPIKQLPPIQSPGNISYFSSSKKFLGAEDCDEDDQIQSDYADEGVFMLDMDQA